jgi:hypothetical protein
LARSARQVSAAQASTYHFSFNGTGGVTPGVVEGDIVLGFDNGTGAASSVTLTSFPASFGALPEGNIATNWTSQFSNSFTVTGGMITMYNFFAITGNTSSGTELCLNNSGIEGSGNGRGCPNTLQYLGDGSSTTSAWAWNSLQITPSAVPVPAAAWLLGSGLLGLAGFARKRKAA